MMVDHALALARKGLAVFPLKARSKTPWTRHGCLDATTDLETIAGWWDGWPDSNIGVATGSKSGIWVLDIDGEPGADELLKLEHRFGALPATVTAVTGTGGHHLYFRLPDFAGAPVMKNTASALAAGIDTRGEGGYVVAPPSIHPNGNPYGWGAPDEFAAAPVWLLALLDTPKVAPSTRVGRPNIGQGLFRTAPAKDAGTKQRQRLPASCCAPALCLPTLWHCYSDGTRVRAGRH